MAQQSIGIGSASNDGTGDPLRTAFNKINANFTELYGASPYGQQVEISGNQISANSSNADLVLSGSGTGGVVASGLRFGGTSISADDSSTVNINDGLNVDGSITAQGDITATGNIFANGNINLGNAAGDQTKVVGVFEADNIQIDGTTITTNKTNASFQIIANGTGAVEVETLQIKDNAITPITTNSNLTLSGNGTGSVSIEAIQVKGTELSSSDSTQVTIKEKLSVTGGASVTGGDLETADITSSGTLVAVQLETDQIRVNDNKIWTFNTNTDLELIPSGTGGVVASSVRIAGTTLSSDDSSLITIAEGLQINGATNIDGTLTTADVSTTGTHTVNGQLDVDWVRIKDHSITTNASDANLNISANSSGVVSIDSAMTTGNITTTGDVVVTGRLDVDNIAINTNGIAATNSNGGININPNGTGTVTIGGGIVNIPATLAVREILTTQGIQLEDGASIQQGITNADLILEVSGTGSIVIAEVSIKGNEITTHVSNADLKLNTDGTGYIDIMTATQSTVGSAGGASALPGAPTGYIKIKVGGTLRVIPFWDQV